MGSFSDLQSSAPLAVSEHFRRQQESGLSIRAYCEREGVAVRQFYYWRRRYSQKSSGLNPAFFSEGSSLPFAQVGRLALNQPRFEIRSLNGITLSVYSEEVGVKEISELFFLLQGSERR